LFSGEGLFQECIRVDCQNPYQSSVGNDERVGIFRRLQLSRHVEQKAGLEFLAPVNQNGLKTSRRQFFDSGKNFAAMNEVDLEVLHDLPQNRRGLLV
jgi:hypothetical protein